MQTAARMYVIDVSALNAVGHHRNGPLIFDVLDDLVKAQQLCFPDEVLNELERLAKGEFTYSWTKATASDRLDKGAPYKYYQAVVHQVRELVDEDAEHESSAATVAAQAKSLMADGYSVTVITEDIKSKPTRMPLALACDILEIPWIGIGHYLESCGSIELWT
ncbi:DUF4411 family protein [Nonomuraea sp. NPDC050536]|uniref:DUF4411 family protein n=1 Tax=Nonomuraea sp. NPDC050536 TaxID=3364366 RepID=UPI0037CB8C36